RGLRARDRTGAHVRLLEGHTEAARDRPGARRLARERDRAGRDPRAESRRAALPGRVRPPQGPRPDRRPRAARRSAAGPREGRARRTPAAPGARGRDPREPVLLDPRDPEQRARARARGRSSPARPRSAQLGARKREQRLTARSAIEFWFDFSSGYGYLAAQEIDALGERVSRPILWRRYMLGTAFKVT